MSKPDLNVPPRVYSANLILLDQRNAFIETRDFEKFFNLHFRCPHKDTTVASIKKLSVFPEKICSFYLN